MAILERNGKTAITNWKVVSTLAESREKGYSLMECRIETGRTHQIRVHMASLGTPVIGDRQYGKSALDKRLAVVPARQMLHAWKLTLWHPTESRQMSFVAPVPADMEVYL
jgi:23S rRNA pseudouridine1911/1915/1917 synthase